MYRQWKGTRRSESSRKRARWCEILAVPGQHRTRGDASAGTVGQMVHNAGGAAADGAHVRGRSGWGEVEGAGRKTAGHERSGPSVGGGVRTSGKGSGKVKDWHVKELQLKSQGNAVKCQGKAVKKSRKSSERSRRGSGRSRKGFEMSRKRSERQWNGSGKVVR